MTTKVTTALLDVSTGVKLLLDRATITPAQITANQNDYNPTGAPTAAIMRLSTDAARSLTGLSGGSDAREIVIHLIAGGGPLTLLNENAGSAAANRFALADDVVIAVGASAHLQYDGTASRWRVLGSGTTASKTEAEAGVDSSTGMSPQRTSQAILANALGEFKNIAGRNGGMEVWQRGSSVAVTASSTAYTLDGWYLALGANEASTVSRQSGLVNGSRYAARVQRNSGQTGTDQISFGFPLDISEVLKARGRALQLIFSVRAGTNWSPVSGTLTYNVYFGTGAPVKQYSAGYTSQTNPITGTVNLTAGGSVQQVVAAISAAVGTTVQQGEIIFTWTPSGTADANDWVEIDDVDLRVVPTGLSASTPSFERSTYQMDLFRCLRHLWVLAPTTLNQRIGIGQCPTTTSAQIVVPTPTIMRAVPAITFVNVTDFKVLDATATPIAVTSATDFGLSSDNALFFQLSVASGLVAGNATQMVVAGGTGKVIASCEI